MPTAISPEEFQAAFHSTVVRRRDEISAVWQAPDELRTLMLSDAGILNEVASELNLDYRPELMGVDATFSDRATGTPVCAIDIEADMDTVRTNGARLAALNFPLKVLITYPPDASLHEKLLKRITLAVETHGSVHGSYLVVFGRCDPTPNWHYFVANTSYVSPNYPTTIIAPLP